jgi:hypothetical protein
MGWPPRMVQDGTRACHLLDAHQTNLNAFFECGQNAHKIEDRRIRHCCSHVLSLFFPEIKK